MGKLYMGTFESWRRKFDLELSELIKHAEALDGNII